MAGKQTIITWTYW